ncbi:hypothetical protein INT44_006199, partial [Umbelopsis vinacea]
ENGGVIPVFRPTMAEFEDFLSFVQAIDSYGREAGIVKIIPPKEWTKSLPDVQNLLETVRVRNPIVQHIIGSQGIYTQTNVEKRRPYTVQQWHQLCESEAHRPPTAKVTQPQSLPAIKKRKVTHHDSHMETDPRKRKTYCFNADHMSPRPMTNQCHILPSGPTTASQAPPSASVSFYLPVTNMLRKPEPKTSSFVSLQTRSKSKHGNILKSSTALDGSAQKFSSTTMSLHQETHLRSPPPSPPRKLNTLATEGQPIKTKRMIKAEELELAQSDNHDPLTFDYHCEDDEKYTVEYCKEMERTYWRNLTFSQPMYGADMQGTLFEDSTKSWNVNKLDNILNRIGVELPGVNTAYLYFGQWKATFAWHVEDMDLYSINYLHFGAPKQWYAIPATYGKRFETVMQNIFSPAYKSCSEFLRHKTFIASPTILANNSIPVSRLVQHEGEFVITFPYGYHSGYNLGFNCAESTNFALDSWVEIGRQAKACTCIGDSVKIDVSVFEPHVLAEEKPSSSEGEEVVRKRKRKHKEPQPAVGVDKCVLCPLLGADLPTDDGRRAHRLCAEFVPDTRVVAEPKGDIVVGVDSIPNARWKLKCLLCGKVDGACIQCRKGRCCRAFHTSCAKDADLTLHVEELEDGTILKEGYCPTHDPVSTVSNGNGKECAGIP